MPGEILISYSHEDESLVNHLASGLKDFGFDVWFAGGELTPGDRLPRIFEKLSKADWVAVVLTKSSLSSPWVKHEIESAVFLSISNGRPGIIPVRVRGAQLPPQMLATIGDRVFVEFDPDHFEEGLKRIRIVLEGGIPESRTNQFRTFVTKSLVVLPWASPAYLMCVSNRRTQPNQEVQSRDDPFAAAERDTLARARAQLKNDMTAAGVNVEDSERVLKAFDGGLHPPVIGTKDRDRVLQWLHRADDTMLALAEDLLKDLRRGRRGVRGVTLNVITDFAEKTVGVDASESRWKAQQLASRALEVGLLETSTEDPRGIEEEDIQTNPSYDFGPVLLSLRRALDPWYDAQSS